MNGSACSFPASGIGNRGCAVTYRRRLQKFLAYATAATTVLPPASEELGGIAGLEVTTAGCTTPAFPFRCLGQRRLFCRLPSRVRTVSSMRPETAVVFRLSGLLSRCD